MNEKLTTKQRILDFISAVYEEVNKFRETKDEKEKTLAIMKVDLVGYLQHIWPDYTDFKRDVEALTAHPAEDEPKKHWQKCRCEDGFPPYPDCWCQAHTAEDEPSRYQTALEVQAEYLKELNKYSKEKSWEEGQSQSGLFMWLGMKLQQEDE